MLLDPARGVRTAELPGQPGDDRPVEHVGQPGEPDRVDALPNQGGNRYPGRFVVLHLGKAVFDQGIQKGCGLFLGRVAHDCKLDAGQHLGVAQDHVDVVLEVPLVGKERGSFHSQDHVGHRRPAEDLAVAFQRPPIEGGVSNQHSHDAPPCVPPVSSPENAGGRV